MQRHMEELKIKFQIPNNIVGENFVGDATYIKMIRGMWNILHTKYISVNIGVERAILGQKRIK
jgi:hypothetical protein